jgi:class 3 adenylate cyclase/tetratricopeptide (TPR) repeat protein
VDIAGWLRELGLERYEEAFRENEIDAEILSKLTADDLRDIGVTTVGHRRKLLEAIAALAEPALAPQAEESAPAEAALKPRPAEAERRQLTVLFCDLVDSTGLATCLDPEDLRRVIGLYQDAAARAIGHYEGHVAKFLGDGLLAYFGYPAAHEDDAERAVRAGLELVTAIAGLEVNLDVILHARVGIATGLVVVGDLLGEASDRDAVVGEAPNLAARLQALAEPDTVVIAPNTRQLLGGLFDLTDLGPHEVKGFAKPMQAWRVRGESTAQSRFEALRGHRLTPLVGRQNELGILRERWAWAKQGEGQVVLLSGEAGIGKSRIVQALRELIAEEPYTLVDYYGSPYHRNSALHPVISRFLAETGLDREQAPERRLGALEALVARSTDRLDEVVPLFAALLSIPTGERYPPLDLSPPRQKQRTLEALVDHLAALAAREPVLALFEDAHWLDPSTLELLDLIVGRVRDLPALLIVTFRPEFTPPWPSRAHVTQLVLNRLGRQQNAAMVERLSGGKALPCEVVDQIVTRTDGVPLFVEELTKTVLESGLLSDAGDHWKLAGPLPDLAIPATLQDSLMARLDRLASVREVAQIGAVIGREFAHELLAAVSPLSEPQLGAALNQLVQSELIFRCGAPPDATYSFKHALVQDAAYQSLLRSRRQQLHAKIAEMLEARFEGTPPEVVARHCTEAGLTDKAVGYWHLAGERAMELSAYREAIAHLGRAHELLLTLTAGAERDLRELELQLALGAAWIPAKAYSADEVRRAYESAVELSRRVGSADQRFVALRGLWNNHLMRVELNAAKELAVQLRAAATETRDTERRLVAERAAGSGLMALGEHREANACFHRGIALYDPERHRHYVRRYGEDSGLWCYGYAAWTDDWLGHRDRALDEVRRAIEMARKLTIPTLAMVLSNAATLYQFRRELDATLACAQETIRLSEQLGMVQLRAWASIHNGWALACAGRTDDGLAEIEAALATWRAIGGLNNRTHFLNLLAEACRLAGKPGAGMAALDEAEDISRRVDLHAHDAETYRRRGELHLALGRAADAEVSWLRAIEVARCQGTRTLGLRAATNLAGLWRDQKRRTKAHDLLAPIYGWFTEGFDTADLKDAKALIEELG